MKNTLMMIRVYGTLLIFGAVMVIIASQVFASPALILSVVVK